MALLNLVLLIPLPGTSRCEKEMVMNAVMTADQHRRLAPAFAAMGDRLPRRLGHSQKPRRCQAALATFLVLLWRMQRPVWSRKALAAVAGYAGPEGVDKAIQAFIASGLFVEHIRAEPGRSRRGPSIRRLRYLEPNPEVFSLVCATVLWRDTPQCRQGLAPSSRSAAALA
jgi:hypothetical protein